MNDAGSHLTGAVGLTSLALADSPSFPRPSPVRFHLLAAFLIVASCLGTPGVAAESASDARASGVEPLTRGRAAAIIASTGELAEALEQRLDASLKPFQPLETPAARAEDGATLDDVRGALASAWEWRWYSRDGGVLVAIPARQRVGTLARARFEALAARMVREVLLERYLANPPVQVVLIEPELPISGCPAGAAGSGGSVAGGAVIGGGFAGGWSGAAAACTCR